MIDGRKDGELTAAFIAAQDDFDERARHWKQACDALDAAHKAKATAEARLSARFDELRAMAHALHERGAPIPVSLRERDLYLSLCRGYEAGLLHASVTPLPEECPDPSAN